MKQKLLYAVAITFGAIFLITGCRKRDAVAADNLVIFETAAQGITATESSIIVRVTLSRPTDRDIPVTINLAEQGVIYGTDYTTTPAATAGNLTVTIPSGNNETAFTVTKSSGVLFDGDEKIVFDLFSSGAPVFIGLTRQFTLNFAELVATNAGLTVNGGGVLFPNKVFIDLSANRQTAVNRNSWDLGFYTGTDDFRVILNSSSAMMAKQIAKNDLTQVTDADTTGFSTQVAFNQFAPVAASLPYIDYPNGDLTRTAIAAVSATDADNKVYIVNRGTGPGSPAPARGWKKIRVLRNASGGYTLQYADIAATTFQQINIAKDEAYFFKYISFDNGAVNVEPEKKKWDLAWTYFSNVTNFGTGEVPYLFQDIIIQNRNVQVVRVMTATRAFADFGEADLTGLTFSSLQATIGSDWRSGGGPTTQPAVRADRYYIIKDGDNNYYKVRFTALTQNGERGYPAFESVLVKKG
ncbi:MAG: HmuY family protein [Chitinophagaceae bacterium]|nr:HmuY family protein [Chitinophagaceae bacterium]